MDETTITLRRACACAIPTVLEALAARARQWMGPNRPYCPFLVVLRIENHMVPYGIQIHRQGTLQSWGVFRKLPGPGDPLGQRALSVTTALCPSCQAKVASTEQGNAAPAPGAHGCSHTPCDDCDGDCCDELQVHFTYFCDFPFLPHEVRQFFFDWFGMPEEARAALPPDYRNMGDVYKKYDAAPSPAAPSAGVRLLACGGDTDGDTDSCGHRGDAGDAAYAAQPARCGRAGAPLLIANQFLLDAMRAQPGLASYNHLRPRWLVLYVAQMGREPDNVEKAFREAVRKCRARLKREHGA